MNPERNNTKDAVMDIVKRCALFLDDKKARDTLVIDLREVNSYLEYFILVTGNSMVHCRSLAREVKKYLGAMGVKQRNKTDYESGWIILDYDELVIHIFTEDLRGYYQLERLWADADRIEYR